MRTRCALLLVLLTVPAWAGKRIVATTATKGDTHRTETWLDAGRMRMDIEGGLVALFLTDNEHPRLVLLDPKKNEFSVVDMAGMTVVISKLQQTLERTFAGLPPETRAQIQASMQAATSQMRVAEKGMRRIKDVECHVYEMRMSEISQETCNADPSDLGLDPVDRAVIGAMERFGKDLTSLISTLPISVAGDWSGFLNSFGSGIPIHATQFEKGVKVSETTLESIEDATFTDADFSTGNAKERDALGALSALP